MEETKGDAPAVEEQGQETPEESQPAEDLQAVIDEANRKAEESEKKFRDQQIRAQKAEDELKKLKNIPEDKPKETLPTREVSDAEITDLRFDGYSKEEARRIISFAKAQDATVDEAKSFLKPSIDAEREAAKAKESTPTPSSRGTQSATKGFKDVIHSSEATKAQKQAAFEEKMNSLKRKGANETV